VDDRAFREVQSAPQHPDLLLEESERFLRKCDPCTSRQGDLLDSRKAP